MTGGRDPTWCAILRNRPGRGAERSHRPCANDAGAINRPRKPRTRPARRSPATEVRRASRFVGSSSDETEISVPPVDPKLDGEALITYALTRPTLDSPDRPAVATRWRPIADYQNVVARGI